MGSEQRPTVFTTYNTWNYNNLYFNVSVIQNILCVTSVCDIRREGHLRRSNCNKRYLSHYTDGLHEHFYISYCLRRFVIVHHALSPVFRLYTAEACTVYKRQVKLLHAFMKRHLRWIMRITWMDKLIKRICYIGQVCHLWKIFWSERISGGLDTSWECHQTGYQSRLSTLNCLTVTERECALVSGLRMPSRETWNWETQKQAHGHHSHSRVINGEQQSSDGSRLCRISTDSMMMMIYMVGII